MFMLTDKALKNWAKKPEPGQVQDGSIPGMFAIVQNGQTAIRFRIKYTHNTKASTKALGTYPKTSLLAARKKAGAIIDDLASGLDPKLVAKRNKLDIQNSPTLNQLADQWIKEEFLNTASDQKYTKRVTNRIKEVCKSIGTLQASDIDAPMLRSSLLAMRDRSEDEAARTLSKLVDIFEFGISLNLCERNPAYSIRKQFKSPKPESRKTILDRNGQQQMIADVLAYDSKPECDLLFIISLISGARIGEIAGGKWDEISWQEKIWYVPAERTKKPRNGPRRAHNIFLPSQQIILLKNLKQITGRNGYLFPSRAKSGHMSKETLKTRINRAGYQGKQDVHGFRSSLSSYLNKEFGHLGNTETAVEIMSHRTPQGVRAIYNRNDYWVEQCVLWQYWADYVEGLLPFPLGELGLKR